MKKQAEIPDYDSAYAELQQIARELQEETAGIEALSAKIARAHELIRFCRERLRKTEEDLQNLTLDA